MLTSIEEEEEDLMETRADIGVAPLDQLLLLSKTRASVMLNLQSFLYTGQLVS